METQAILVGIHSFQVAIQPRQVATQIRKQKKDPNGWHFALGRNAKGRKQSPGAIAKTFSSQVVTQSNLVVTQKVLMGIQQGLVAIRDHQVKVRLPLA